VSAAPSVRVVVDRRVCVGTSNCAEAAPEAFEMDDSNVPRLLAGAPREAVLAGARACPVGAIICFEATTGQRIPPC